MKKLLFASLLFCGCQWSAVADPITIQLPAWRFVVDNAAPAEARFQFTMNGVGSDGKSLQLSATGQGSIPGTNQPNGSALVNFGPFSFRYGDVSLFSPGQCCPGPPFYPNLAGGITFSPTTPPAGGDPRTITSILSFTPTSGLALFAPFTPGVGTMQVGSLSFSLTGAATIAGATGPNDPQLKMVITGTGGTATLTLTPAAEIPEPATLLLLGGGLGALAWRRRRQRNEKAI